MRKSTSNSQIFRKIIQTALLIALALAVKSLSIMVSFMGAPGMRIGFAQVFSRMPALLFGPFFGGLATGIVDVLGYLIRPEGAYIPLLTLTQVLDGVLVGFIFKEVKKAETKKIQTTMWITFITLGVIGVVNLVISKFFARSSLALALDSMGKRKDYLIMGLVVVSMIGLLLMLLNYRVQKKLPDSETHKYYLKILITFALVGIPVTILNTYILILFIPGLSKIGFTLFLIPRLLEEILMTVIISYITAFLLAVYDKVIYKKQVIEEV
ncbi:MAG: hypothetical protein GX625_13855 [Clostridiaceae bacterium]|nr:hypothetical protein [Clostridiaceae bacterium]